MRAIMKKNIFIPLALLACISGGCGIYSSYERPEVLPGEYIYGDSSATPDAHSLAVLSWRELFADPLLAAWIEAGLENNTDLQIARLKVEEASAALKASRLAYLPSLGLSAQGSAGSRDGGGTSRTYSLEGTSEWEIDLFGRMRNAKQQDIAALEQSEAYRQAVQTQLIATITESYYSLLVLDRQLEISRETVANWESTVRMMSALKETGGTDSAAISQAKANMLSAEQSILSLEQQIRTLENAFASLIGILPQEIERGDYLDLEIPSAYSSGIPLEMIGNRPDVKVAEYDLKKAFYAVGEARSNFYPQLTLSGSAGWTDSAGEAVANPEKWLFNALGSLVQPLFNRGRNMSKLKIAKAAQEEALLSYRQKILDAGTEVNDALIQWQTARESLELSARKIGELENTVESTRLLMQHGHINYLEVLTAQQSLLDARLREVSDKYDEIQGVISLYHALGGGVE
ncbi:MAG: TolC family protein [Candidatus Cryptobacteroides sp.]